MRGSGVPREQAPEQLPRLRGKAAGGRRQDPEEPHHVGAGGVAGEAGAAMDGARAAVMMA